MEGVVQRAQVGVDLLAERAGQEAEPLPASTAGRVRMIRFTFFDCSACTALAIARYVLPVPAGPMPNEIVCLSIDST